MFFAALDRLQRGTLVCVFDATDRIQHMFWRYHRCRRIRRGARRVPALTTMRSAICTSTTTRWSARVMEQARATGDVLMVISDHGFSSFRRGVNLNAWLLREGLSGAQARRRRQRRMAARRRLVATRARTALGPDRHVPEPARAAKQQGIVEPGAEAARSRPRSSRKLNGLRDADKSDGRRSAKRSTPATLYAGPYLENAPDLLIGYNAGYRISWDCATGVVAGPVFEDNMKAWSGDHCIDPRLVPGVFFCNRSIDADEPALVDIAPTALQLFGIEPPAYMDGRPLAGLA